MKKRTLLMAIALVASLALVATGTLAYLTDTDSDVNVMTLGNVDIEQHEMKRADGVKYNATLEEGDLEPFEDGIKLFPAYPTTAEPEDAYEAMQDKEDGIKWGPYVHDSNAWNGLWSDDNLVGVVDKMVFVENTGSSDAYVRTLLAFEKPEGVMIGWGSEHADIVLNMNGNSLYGNSAGKASTVPMCEIEIDGITYEVYEFCYDLAMKPGEWTRPSLLQVVMTNWADNETVALLGDTYEVLALSQAVQVENLEQLGAQGALDAAFGKVDIENATKWFSEIEGLPVVAVSTADELVAAFENLDANILLTDDIELEGEWTPIGDKEAEIYFTGTLDGAGHTISGLQISDGDYASLIAAMDGGTVKNLTVEGTVTAKNAAGIVARMESGKIENCVSNVNVTGTSKAGGIVCMSNRGGCEIVGCVNNGNVTGGNDGLGGIVGFANDGLTIRDCENNGTIGSASYRYAGGMVGYMTLTGTPNPGVGSLITGCVNNGAVAASTGAGGIVGISTNNPNQSITACKNTSADITSTQAYGGILGIENVKTTVTDCVNDASGLNLIGRPQK